MTEGSNTSNGFVSPVPMMEPMEKQQSLGLTSTGIFKLMAILQDHMDIMQGRDAEVEKVLAATETADDLREAKKVWTWSI